MLLDRPRWFFEAVHFHSWKFLDRSLSISKPSTLRFFDCLLLSVDSFGPHLVERPSTIVLDQMTVGSNGRQIDSRPSTLMRPFILRFVYSRDTCSWKGQLERTRSWKVLSWKFWSWQISLEFERVRRSWKESIEVGKFELKLESSGWSWEVQLKLESLNPT